MSAALHLHILTGFPRHYIVLFLEKVYIIVTNIASIAQKRCYNIYIMETTKTVSND
jgi:hypothetical protein